LESVHLWRLGIYSLTSSFFEGAQQLSRNQRYCVDRQFDQAVAFRHCADQGTIVIVSLGLFLGPAMASLTINDGASVRADGPNRSASCTGLKTIVASVPLKRLTILLDVVSATEAPSRDQRQSTSICRVS
jgi:hypothetical protein